MLHMPWQRIERLMLTTGSTWEGLSRTLKVSTAMLSMIKTGKRNPSKKVLFRLLEAEREAGIAPPLPPPAHNPPPASASEPGDKKRMKFEREGLAGGEREGELRAAIRMIREGLDLLERHLGGKS